MAPTPFEKKARVWMQVVISIGILAASFYVLLSKQYDEAYAKWASGWIGLVIGYWLS